MNEIVENACRMTKHKIQITINQFVAEESFTEPDLNFKLNIRRWTRILKD